MIMWKCKKCDYIVSGSGASIHTTNGYCPKCKEAHLLERYDPLNEEEPEPPI